MADLKISGVLANSVDLPGPAEQGLESQLHSLQGQLKLQHLYQVSFLSSRYFNLLDRIVRSHYIPYANSFAVSCFCC